MYSEIYLVDDMEMVNVLHQVLLRELGLEEKVKAYVNPEEALDELRFNASKLQPILVLLDVSMPEMTGFEFLEFMTLESIPQNIDVIIVTSSEAEEDKLLAKQYPQYVRNFITKPIRLEDLQLITDQQYSS